MFNNLFNLEFKRSKSQAVGFYIIYVLIGLLLAGLAGVIAAIIYPDINGIMLGGIIGTIYTLFVYFYSYRLKNLHSTYLIILGLTAALLAYLFGILISFIVVAYLTTKSKSSVDESNTDDDDDKPNEVMAQDESDNIMYSDDSK